MQRSSLLAVLFCCACGAAVEDPCAASADPVSMEAATAAGSAESVLALVEGEEHQVLSGLGFGTVDMTLSVQWSGQSAAWREQAEPAQQSRDYACYDSLSVPVDIHLVTADGQLNEDWSVELFATEPGAVLLQKEVLIDDLKGTWRPDVSELVDLRLRARIYWTEAGSEGVLTAVGTPTDGGPDESWDVAVWPG